MGRPCSIEIHKLVEMLPNKQYCRCILCDKTLSGAVRSNIKRHYERLHPEVVLPKAKKRKHLTHLKASSNKGKSTFDIYLGKEGAHIPQIILRLND